MGLVRLAAPAEPVVTVDEALLSVRADGHDEDDLVVTWVAAATAQAEAYCRRRFVTQQWRQTYDLFPSVALKVSYPQLVSVESVKYVDGDGVLQTIDAADYVVRTAETPGEIVPAYGKSWPSARGEPDAVRVEITCGYGAAADVPGAIKTAVLLVVGTLNANRETVALGTISTQLPQSAKWLLDPFRVQRF